MKLAVVVHIYYVALWKELAASIKNISEDFDLFVTLSESIADKTAITAEILKGFPAANVEIVENKGYDILPFLKVLKTLDLDRYSGVVKLHTKRDMPTDDFKLQPEWRGKNWREALLGFLSTKEAWQSALAKFVDPKVSMVADMRVFYRTKEECSKSFRIDLDVENFCRDHLGIKIDGLKVSFIAGTMFLAKPSVMKALQTLELEKLDFGVGNSHQHSIAHVLERVIGVLAEKAGGIAAWQGDQTMRKFVLKRNLYRAYQETLRFFYQKKTTKKGYNIVKILKLPVWRAKAKYLKKTYDLCFGIGEACMTSQALREAGLQFASYPFDWIGSKNPLKCVELLTSSFDDFLNRENFQYHGRNAENGMGQYRNVRTEFGHPHDFADKPVIDDVMYRNFNDKYTRRIARLTEQLTKSKRVFMFCICMPDTPKRNAEELQKIRATVLAKYPHLELDFLVIQCDSAIPFEEKRLSVLSEGVYETRFEYSDPRSRIDISKLLLALKEFGIKAVDYRSQAEKAAYGTRKKRAKYAKFGSSTKLGYEFKRHIAFPIRRFIATLKRKRYQHILSLGMNCEVAFRQVVAWGAVDSSLFNWGTTRYLSLLMNALENFSNLFNGEIERGPDGLWRCVLTNISTHGRTYTEEDREDTRARMKYLKDKFLKQISDSGRTLLIYRLSDKDLEAPTLKEDLLKLDSVLRKLGAKNHEYLLIVEKRNAKKVPRIRDFHVRTVSAFNPIADVANEYIGDYVGWITIFTEFVPFIKPQKKSAYKFERKVYDICFPLGQVCMASQSLREAGLQFASYPFDWSGGLKSLLPYAEIIASDFKDFMNREDFTYKGTNEVNGLAKYYNSRNKFWHPHDFIDRSEIDDEMYRDFTNKYNRRISRLISQLSNAKTALMVSVCHVTHPIASREEIIATRETLAKRFPQLDLDYIVFQYSSDYHSDKPLITEISPNIKEIRFDYSSAETAVNIPMIVEALKAMGIETKDYRTRKEIAAFKRMKKRKNNG